MPTFFSILIFLESLFITNTDDALAEVLLKCYAVLSWEMMAALSGSLSDMRMAEVF